LILRTITRKSIQFYSFDSLNPPFHNARTHDSNIPEFQHSNWGEARNLINYRDFIDQSMSIYLTNEYLFDKYLSSVFSHIRVNGISIRDSADKYLAGANWSMIVSGTVSKMTRTAL
jgi:hypothetical protein